MAVQVAMKSAAAELWDGVAQAAHDVIKRQQGPAPKLDDDGLPRPRSVPCCRANVAPWAHRR
jgi:hypothetical protein